MDLTLQSLTQLAETEASGSLDLTSFESEILSRLIEALNSSGRLNSAGIGFHHQRLVEILKNRIAIDQWFKIHPEINEEHISDPIVVVGLPRTGTTLLHRTIAADSRLLAPLWYEVRNPVPLSESFVESDTRIPKAEAEVAAILSASPELAAIHPMDATAPDEEIMLLEHSFMSTVPECYAYLPDFGNWLYEQDQTPGYEYLYRILQFLQWQKRQRGLTGTRWLLKTPHHLHYPRALAAVFPRAKVVQTHRHPLEVIPSYGSMMCALAAPFTDHLDRTAMTAHWAHKWQCGLDATLAARADEGLSLDYLDLAFTDLLADPKSQIERVYAFINEDLTQRALEEMASWQELNTRESRPEHHYTLEEFGLSENLINEQFSTYIGHYF